MTAEEWIEYAKRLIADQAIRILALTDELAAAQRELVAAKAALATDISQALGREVSIDGTVTMAVEP